MNINSISRYQHTNYNLNNFRTFGSNENFKQRKAALVERIYNANKKMYMVFGFKDNISPLITPSTINFSEKFLQRCNNPTLLKKYLDSLTTLNEELNNARFKAGEVLLSSEQYLPIQKNSRNILITLLLTRNEKDAKDLKTLCNANIAPNVITILAYSKAFDIVADILKNEAITRKGKNQIIDSIVKTIATENRQNRVSDL